jgi:hypothetical protein
MADIKLKRDGYGLDFRTFESDNGKNNYLVFRNSDGAYHTFVEVEAKDAAVHCGSKLEREEITRKHWDELWQK